VEARGSQLKLAEYRADSDIIGQISNM
jgi:hypothetical protein